MEPAAQICSAIAQTLDPLPEVRAALLFGSQAIGRARPDSDIDIAILLDPALAPPDTHSRLIRVLDALTTQLDADRLDIVFLNDAPPKLAFQVLAHGAVALERDPTDLHRFRVRTYSAHADREHVERFFREVIKRRALAEAKRG